MNPTLITAMQVIGTFLVAVPLYVLATTTSFDYIQNLLLRSDKWRYQTCVNLSIVIVMILQGIVLLLVSNFL